ncbi:MAG TPA: orotidine-5'-phosphate decarboxylase [Phycisphaerae bacterium]|nr:orotidine-5'-phosphate decarboxylase [Phycisphaerae bacterium]
MSDAYADRLWDAVQRKAAPAAIALDPVFQNLPAEFSSSPVAERESISRFCREILAIIAPLVPVVKINSAYFEKYGGQGVGDYYQLVADASRKGLLVIGDVKRGDVGHTAEMYAAAHLDGSKAPHPSEGAVPDAVTVSGYFGLDGVKPFIDLANAQGRGLFVLVRTSNPSAAVIQDAELNDGRKVHELMAAEVALWARDSATTRPNGYSSVGAVVATRNAGDAARLRALLPQSWLLVPGYGAQGGRAEDFIPYFKPDSSGALIAAGRSVIFAHQSPGYRDRFGDDWRACVEQACKDFVADLRRVVPG